jgi:hypothetical protein
MRMTILFGCPFSGFFDFSLSVADCLFLWLLPRAILVVQWWSCWVVLKLEGLELFCDQSRNLGPGLSYRRR